MDKVKPISKTFTENLSDATRKIQTHEHSPHENRDESPTHGKSFETTRSEFHSHLIEVEGVSPFGWEDAARRAFSMAQCHARNIAWFEITRQWAEVEHGTIKSYCVMIFVRYREEHITDQLSPQSSITSRLETTQKSKQISTTESIEIDEKKHQEIAEHYQEIHELGEDDHQKTDH